MEETRWEDSPEFRSQKEKKEKGERVRALLQSPVWGDIKDILDVHKKGALMKCAMNLSNHAELVGNLVVNLSYTALEEILAGIAKDADIDLSEPVEDPSPDVSQ